jgi:hypothetical protein
MLTGNNIIEVKIVAGGIQIEVTLFCKKGGSAQ